MGNQATVPCDCKVLIDIPNWVPSVVAMSILVAAFIAVIAAYSCREMERHKNYYGKEDKMSIREELKEEEAKKKEQMDAYAYGACVDEVLVIKSPERRLLSPGNTGVKVMLRKKKVIQKTPVAAIASASPADRTTTQSTPFTLTIQVQLDKTGRAFELIEIMKAVELPAISRQKKSDILVEAIRQRLEMMTNKHFVVYGIATDSSWIVKGHENLLENVEEMMLQMRLLVGGPVELKIMAYQVQTAPSLPATGAEASPHKLVALATPALSKGISSKNSRVSRRKNFTEQTQQASARTGEITNKARSREKSIKNRSPFSQKAQKKDLEALQQLLLQQQKRKTPVATPERKGSMDVALDNTRASAESRNSKMTPRNKLSGSKGTSSQIKDEKQRKAKADMKKEKQKQSTEETKDKTVGTTPKKNPPSLIKKATVGSDKNTKASSMEPVSQPPTDRQAAPPARPPMAQPNTPGAPAPLLPPQMPRSKPA